MSLVHDLPPQRRPIPAPLADLAWLLWSVSRDTLADARPGQGPAGLAAFGLEFIEEVVRVDGPRRPASFTRLAAGSARAIRARAGLGELPPIVA